MDREGWKVLAVASIIINLSLMVLWIYGYVTIHYEEKMQRECFYDVCSDYPDAEVLDKVCYCYDFDMLGDLFLVKTKIMD